ncbi:MAG: hypothetical protein ACR2IL_04315 [Chitinophagaceae bacterium]
MENETLPPPLPETQPEPQSQPFQIKKEGLPGILGVLTVLTIIASVFGIIGSFFTGLGCRVLEMDAVVDKMKPNDLAFLQATCENKTILMIASIVGGVLCLVAAILMRQLKQQGFIVYLVGQILPTLISFIVMGEFMFKSLQNLVGVGIMLVFIGLYFTQRKYLTQ